MNIFHNHIHKPKSAIKAIWDRHSHELLEAASQSSTSIDEVAATDPRFTQMSFDTLANVMANATQRAHV